MNHRLRPSRPRRRRHSGGVSQRPKHADTTDDPDALRLLRLSDCSSRLFSMALLTSLLTPCLHISELPVRRPLLRSRSHAVCKIDVDTANAFSCMGFNIGRQVPAGVPLCSLTLSHPSYSLSPPPAERAQRSRGRRARRAPRRHPALWRAAARRPRPTRPPARPASTRPSAGRPPASASLGQLAEMFWLAGYTGLVFHPGTTRSLMEPETYS